MKNTNKPIFFGEFIFANGRIAHVLRTGTGRMSFVSPSWNVVDAGIVWRGVGEVVARTYLQRVYEDMEGVKLAKVFPAAATISFTAEGDVLLDSGQKLTDRAKDRRLGSVQDFRGDEGREALITKARRYIPKGALIICDETSPFSPQNFKIKTEVLV